MRNRFLLVSVLTLGALLLVGSGVKASDTFSAIYNNSAPQVTIIYDTSNNATNTVNNVLATPFTVTGTSGVNNGVQFQAFCVDLWHTFQSPFSANLVTLSSSSTLQGLLAPNSSPAYTPGANLANQLGYIGTVLAVANNVTGAGGQNLTDALAAVQLAIWSLIDQPNASNPHFAGFKFSGGDTALNSDYAAIIAALGGTTSTSGGYTSASGLGGSSNATGTHSLVSSGSASLTDYVTTPAYTSATLVQVDRSASTSQNLLTFAHNITTTSVTPEPSTMAIAGLGALGMIGYGWKRRKRA
ncbi:MAG: PEP-CTERM sorting domain-containing protein [Isosphaeraceae bacterium]|jgi:PEP-CTERM motif-containing protein